ncbi:dTDP-4-dehydrorhamnose reductase [Ferruginibacter albus]|uniref:dTDP-4-dehydrorhamnose reductase n=1 Tax=Ferruginibacter albus TaxID=2875540 RepID=UPI001CC4F480|nr:dTDP-4-dehydrorhamnose reductase [Ferruginibacter albus]UAY52550.1 dTDP-4-dehydrorhamnose reductase [Ferruginibacter albus]
MPTILVTGANGQLGNELRVLSAGYPQYDFLFVTRNELSIGDLDAVTNYFNENKIDHCINCAAYTAVDKAESDIENAFLINGEAVGNLAAVCKQHAAKFIHVSTDYVFDGTATEPIKEDRTVNPIGIYGASKLKGEELAFKNNPDTIIIRTSWVYSSFGNNFVKTMMRLMKERESINVVNDQRGCPTYAADLAAAIMTIVEKRSAFNTQYSIFNYSNSGNIVWYDFAIAIKELIGSNCIVNPIPTSQFPTPAKRPAYSLLDTTKIQQTFGVGVPEWKESLKKCLAILTTTA